MSKQLVKKFYWLEPFTVPQKGFSKCFSEQLQKCEHCGFGVYTLHQPQQHNSPMVCGWCFDLIGQNNNTK
jgi:hypothetical protein